MKLHLGQYTLDGVFLFYIQYLIEFISHHSLEKTMLCGIIILSYFIQKEKVYVRYKAKSSIKAIKRKCQ